MTPATTRGAAIPVAAVLLVLFSATAALSTAYHATRRNRAEARFTTGMELAKEGKNAQAVEEFRAALTYVHNDPRYRMELARSLIALGRWGEAESHLSELREDDPTSGPINLMLARLEVRDRRDRDAVTYYQRAIYGLWPDHPSDNRTAARFELVGLLEKEHQEKQVLAELLDLADETPESDVASRRRIAALLLSHGSPQHASELFRGILDAHPDDAEAEKGLADSLFVMGDFLAARSAYRLAARHDPNDPAIGQRIAAADAVVNLDPTLVRLSGTDRFDRAQELVRLTLQSVEGCATLPADLLDEAHKAEEEPAARRRDGDTLVLLSLAEQLWKARQQTCASAVPASPALTAVMMKLQKQ